MMPAKEKRTPCAEARVSPVCHCSLGWFDRGRRGAACLALRPDCDRLHKSAQTSRYPTRADMTGRIPENVSTWLVDWSILSVMGKTMPPRDPNHDDDTTTKKTKTAPLRASAAASDHADAALKAVLHGPGMRARLGQQLAGGICARARLCIAAFEPKASRLGEQTLPSSPCLGTFSSKPADIGLAGRARCSRLPRRWHRRRCRSANKGRRASRSVRSARRQAHVHDDRRPRRSRQGSRDDHRAPSRSHGVHS